MEKLRLENIIRKKGFSKRQLAYLCGIDFFVFCGRIRGETEFTLGEIEKIIYCLSLDEAETKFIFFDK